MDGKKGKFSRLNEVEEIAAGRGTKAGPLGLADLDAPEGKQIESSVEKESESFFIELYKELRPILMHGAVFLVMLVFLCLVYALTNWMKSLLPIGTETIDMLLKIDGMLMVFLTAMYSIYTAAMLGKILVKSAFK